MCLLPIDRVPVDIPLPRPRRVKPVAEKPVLPYGAGGVVGAGDQPGVRGADRLAGQRLADPHLAFPAVVKAHVGVLAVELLRAELGADLRPGMARRFGSLTEFEHSEISRPCGWLGCNLTADRSIFHAPHSP